MRKFEWRLLAFTISLGLTTALVPITVAQQATSVETVQETPKLRSGAQLRNILRADDTTAESAASVLAELTQLAETDADAKLYLAELYSKGYPAVPTDLARAVVVLKEGVAAGDVRAMVRLGNLYRDPQNGLDTNMAIDYFRQAADMGDVASAARVADAYRRGTYGLPVDLNSAIKYYETAAATGHLPSMMRLGDIYRTGAAAGLDPSDALPWYEQAALGGVADASYRLGDLYRTEALGEPDLDRAVEYYEAAVAGGSAAALMRLANGLMNESLASGRQHDGVALLQSAVEQNMAGARVALARAYFTGTGVARDAAEGVSVLEGGVEAGDLGSARYLIRLYTEGRTAGVSKNLEAARQILETIEPWAEGDVQSFEQLVIDAAASGSPGDYENIASQFLTLSSEDQRNVLDRVYLLNRNAYVFVIQDRLVADGYFEGTPNGLLTQATISAVNRACTDLGILDKCRLGPLSGPARRAIHESVFR